jgi:hypothetical protein
MRIIADNDGFTGFVFVTDDTEATTIDLSDTVVASLSSDGRFIGLDIMDTRPFGVPFDEVAARRALDWASDRLDTDTAG